MVSASGTPRRLRDWLATHAQQCVGTVETWMVRSLPVASQLVTAVWADPAWSAALRHAVIWAVDARNQPDPETVGFLRAASARGLGIVTLDGETEWLHAEAIGIPHPALLEQLEDLRDFATELDLEQQLHQLHRETWARPKDALPSRIETFSNGRFEQVLQAISRARACGYSMRGPYAVCRILDGGALIEARYWIGGGNPTDQAVTGTLEWVGPDGQSLPPHALGPVAYAEGMRMAARIYAGRLPDESPA